jgi:hypothetical protein
MTVVFSNWGKFNSEEEARDNFGSYFERHYKPLLNKIADCPYPKIDLSENDKRLLGFLRDDLTKIFVCD